MIFSQDALNKMFGEAWAHLLFEEFDMGQEFDQVIKSLGPELKKYVVYPPRPQVFRAFKDTRPETVKVIFLVQDPYHDGRATGLIRK